MNKVYILFNPLSGQGLKKEKIDIISINNTIAYITDKDSRINTINDIYRTLKKNGTFITDPYYNFIKEANLSERFFKIADGIYKKE